MRNVATIQYLRAVAALAVVIGHAQHDAKVWSANIGIGFSPSGLLPWGAGVDLFFVISGFIMVHASQNLFGMPGGARQFAARRLIRIVPLWWLMATLYLVAAVIQAKSSGKPLASTGDTLAAYLFWPVDTFADGFPRPFYTLGWTLNFEMFFYACFAAMLFLPRTLAIVALATGLATFVAMGSSIGFAATPLAFWSQPIVLEFVLGMLIALASYAGLQLSGAMRLLLVALACLWLHFDLMHSLHQPPDWITPNDLMRVAAWGLPSALLVIAATCGAQSRPQGTAARLGVLAGDASYALYLTHPFVIVIARKAMLATGLFQAGGGWLMVLVACIVAMAVAVAVHRRIEKPISSTLNRLILQRTSQRWTPARA